MAKNVTLNLVQHLHYSKHITRKRFRNKFGMTCVVHNGKKCHAELATSDITLSKIKAIADRLGVHPKDLLDFEN